MENLMLLWDEIDEWTSICRHLATSAAREMAGDPTPLGSIGSALAVWLLLAIA